MIETESESRVLELSRAEDVRAAQVVVEIHSLREQVRVVKQIHQSLIDTVAGCNERARELKVEREQKKDFASYRSVNSARLTAVGVRSVADIVLGELKRLKGELAAAELRRAEAQPIDSSLNPA